MVALSAATVSIFPAPSRAAATLEQTLTAQAGKAKDGFGVSVAISGDTAVVGAPNEGGMGAAYVFTRSDGAWTERATLVAPVRVTGGKFGFDVALEDDTIVVGATAEDEENPGPGAAHVFVGSGGDWALQRTLTASDPQPGDRLGADVAVSGDTVVAGAPKHDVGGASDQGSAYVFTRRGDVWSEQELTARDGAAGEAFGSSVAVSEDQLVVGRPGPDVGVSIDPGSANVFTRSGSTWTEDAKLIAADRLPLDAFGASVAISHDMIVVGAILDDLHGSAYVFEQDGGSWAQKAKLEPPDGFPVDQFGRSAAIGPHSTVVVGAHFHGGDPEPYPSGRGAAYVFDRQADVWSAPTMLTEPGSRIFGNSVGISGHTVMVGAGFTQVGENVEQGAVYVYKLRPPTPATSGDDHGRGAGKETGGASDGVNGHPLSASLLPETR